MQPYKYILRGTVFVSNANHNDVHNGDKNDTMTNINLKYIQSSPSIVTPDIVTSLPISTFALAQVTNKLIKKTLSLITSYSIFIITLFFLVPRGVTIKGVDCNSQY